MSFKTAATHFWLEELARLERDADATEHQNNDSASVQHQVDQKTEFVDWSLHSFFWSSLNFSGPPNGEVRDFRPSFRRLLWAMLSAGILAAALVLLGTALRL